MLSAMLLIFTLTVAPELGADVKLADRQMYHDAYGAVSRENSCSRFFGGPERATAVLNELAVRMKQRSMPGRPQVLIYQGGGFSKVYDRGLVYRLFNDVFLNTFKRPAGTGEPQYIGSYGVYTKPGRALALLHEVGHLLPAEGGGWLLKSDGEDLRLARHNNSLVEEQCRGELARL